MADLRLIDKTLSTQHMDNDAKSILRAARVRASLSQAALDDRVFWFRRYQEKNFSKGQP